MTKAWFLHVTKTAGMIIYLTFSGAYWESETKVKDDEHRPLLESGDSWLIVIVMLTLSTIIDFICWRFRKIAMSLFYFESIWILIDTIFIIQSVTYQNALIICVRFIAVVVLFGTNAFQSILIATIGTMLSLIAQHIFFYKNTKNANILSIF